MEEAFFREVYQGRDEWLDGRRSPVYSTYRLTATNASVICGDSPWQTPGQLYDEKLGLSEVKDISDKPYVQYGIRMEDPVRRAAMLDLPFFHLEYHPYDILTNKKRRWMGATLDGELTVVTENPWDLPIGSKGIYEGKTGSFRGRSDLQPWEDGIPQHYYEQTLHQLNTTEWDFVLVAARLRRDPFKDEDNGFPEIRNYYRLVDTRSRRTRGDMESLIGLEEEFISALKEKRRPSTRVHLGGRHGR